MCGEGVTYLKLFRERVCGVKLSDMFHKVLNREGFILLYKQNHTKSWY